MTIPLGSHTTLFVYPKLSLSCDSGHRWKAISNQPRVCELWFPWNRLEINSTLQVPVIYYYLIKSVRTNALTWKLFHRPGQRTTVGFVDASSVIHVCMCSFHPAWLLHIPSIVNCWDSQLMENFLKSTMLFQHYSLFASSAHHKEFFFLLLRLSDSYLEKHWPFLFFQPQERSIPCSCNREEQNLTPHWICCFCFNHCFPLLC